MKLEHLDFERPVRDRPGNGPVRACVAEAVRKHQAGWLRTNPAQETAALTRISSVTRH
ncbi:hypothetical protein [Streptomyces sp. BE303]|uniref:hypothetical protein n=1 Tax=Streptomyces sp. BE303 TaxID=3002528 RepID=UPI002E78BC84|nr:hypothetical protein [Streptomyces sp. BE303]MED7949585.1 hypothetical protein [Streptomyces sp. BE303]